MSKIFKKANKNPLTGLETAFEFEEIRISKKGENVEIGVKHIEYDLEGNPYKSELVPNIFIKDSSSLIADPMSISQGISELSEEDQTANKVVLNDLKLKIVKIVEQSFSKLKFK